MTARLEDDVRNAPARDSRTLDPIDIAVSGDGGIVTLRGNVRSFKQRRAVVEDAKEIAGVYEVVDRPAAYATRVGLWCTRPKC
jgi:osmotically-inducible protein OsmY